MLADRGDALGKEAKNWLKRPVGRETRVTSGAGGGEECILLGFLLFGGSYGQTMGRPVGCRRYGASGPSAHFRLHKGSSLLRDVKSMDVSGRQEGQIRWCRIWGPQQGRDPA